MTAKRPAQYELDEKTLDPKAPLQTPSDSSKPNQPTQTHPERNILAVKKDTDNDPKPSETSNGTHNETKPAAINLFSSHFNQPTPTNGSGLFSNGTTGLFNNSTSSLLNNNNTRPSLFGSSSGLFGSSSITSNQPKTGGLFGNSGTSGGSIFDFKNTGVPPVRQGTLFGSTGGQGNEEDDSGDSAELEATQNIDADPTKSKITYNYESTCALVLKQKAFKFKKIGSDLIENVDIVITFDKSTQLYYISIQLPATKKNIYSGVLISKKSQVKHLNNKKENVEISAFNIVKGKPEQAVLRCQFEKEAQGVEVHDTVNQIIEGAYVLKEEEKVKIEKNGENPKEQVKKEETEKGQAKKEEAEKKEVGKEEQVKKEEQK